MSRHHLLSTISHNAAALLVGLTIAACGEGTPPADPTQVLLARTEGLTALRQDRLEDAEARFQDLRRMVPDEAPAYGYLALVELRRGRLDEAQRWIREGLERAENDPDLRLMLASALRASGNDEAARAELEASVAHNAEHLPTIFALAELDAGPGPELEARATRLVRLLELAPANAAVRLDVAETLLRLERADSATAHLETLRQQLPDAPRQARAAFDSAVALSRSGATVEALDRLERFRGYFEVTGPYQAARSEVAPPPGQMVGIPTFTFSYQFTLQVREEDAVLEALRYAEGSALAGLDQVAALGPDPVMAMGDFDGDGDEDLFAAGTDGSGAPAWVLLRVDLGLFVPLPAPPGSTNTGRPRAAVAGDYDNDGFLDLFVTGDAGSALLRNLGDGSFEDVSSSSGVVDVSGRAAVFADLDHDGDLDLYVAGDGPNAFLRNNGDGSFTDLAATSGLSGNAGDLGRSVAFADLDDDGDLDLVVANEGSRPSLFTNEREGRFREVGDSVGLGSARGTSLAVADYDADGALDVFLTGDDAPTVLYRNRGDGTFEPRTPWPASALQGVSPREATFLDFDNDGRQDLLVSGPARTADGRGSVLLHNQGGTFGDATDKLPASAGPASALAVVDYNEDGDLDVFMATPDGLLLLRNDGGNTGHFLQIELQGLATGSGKNNRKGIGSRIEVRSGDLYQVVVVTDPTIHLGLGSHRKADVVRIEWTNGVVQDVHFPGTDQALEEQILKGSCPMLFTWDGQAYVFHTDVMWKSALGMPTGIMGDSGVRSYGPPGASREYVKIPGRALKPKDGRYSLQITEELWETFYLDEVKLLAVDHPDSVDVFVDERFVPPGPWVAPRPYLVSRRYTPLSAVDDKGRDVLAELREHDDRYVSTLVPGRYQGLTERHDLILELGPEAAADSVLLFLRGWLFPTDASINVAMAQSGQLTMEAPVVQVPDPAGGWVTVIDDLSFPSGKDKTVIADLSGKFLSGDRRVRIRTNMQIYWGHAFFSTGGSGGALALTTLDAVEADLHYRGFSRTYRKGGRYGPHWFDYRVVTTDAKWRDLIGSYTRYGDVTPLLDASDDMYVIMNAGDETTIEFDAGAAPDLPAGWSRDFLLYTVAWVKDGDLNTATGKSVEPLPFHGMSEYPYGPDESYPGDEAHLRYLREYNTRRVAPSGRF